MEPKMCKNRAPYITPYGRIIQHTAISVWNNISKSLNRHSVHINIYTPNHFSDHIPLLHTPIQIIDINIKFPHPGFYCTTTLFWHNLCSVNMSNGRKCNLKKQNFENQHQEELTWNNYKKAEQPRKKYHPTSW